FLSLSVLVFALRRPKRIQLVTQLLATRDTHAGAASADDQQETQRLHAISIPGKSRSAGFAFRPPRSLPLARPRVGTRTIGLPASKSRCDPAPGIDSPGSTPR